MHETSCIAASKFRKNRDTPVYSPTLYPYAILLASTKTGSAFIGDPHVMLEPQDVYHSTKREPLAKAIFTCWCKPDMT